MEKLQWSESFSVGVAELDEQHQKIINMINGLVDVMETDRRHQISSKTAKEMMNYIALHFTTEEHLLNEHEYPELDDHHEKHESFSRETSKFFLATELEVENTPEAMLMFLQNWLRNHILVEDKKYQPFLAAKGVH